MPLVAQRVEHPFYGAVGLLLGVDGPLVDVVLPDRVQGLRVQGHALPVFLGDARRALGTPVQVRRENEHEHREKQGHPLHAGAASIHLRCGVLPHARNCRSSAPRRSASRVGQKSGAA